MKLQACVKVLVHKAEYQIIVCLNVYYQCIYQMYLPNAKDFTNKNIFLLYFVSGYNVSTNEVWHQIIYK